MKTLFRIWKDLISSNQGFIILFYSVSTIVPATLAIILEGCGFGVTPSVLLSLLTVFPSNLAILLIWRKYSEEAWLIKIGWPKYRGLHFDVTLRRAIANWAQPTTDALYHASEVFQRFHYIDFLRDNQSAFLAFLNSCYDPQRDFFKQAKNSDVGMAQYSHCALGVLKAIEDIPCSGSLGMKLAERHFGSRAEKLAVKASRWATKIISEGATIREGSLVEIYSCFGILRNLRREELADEIHDKVIQSILNLLVHASAKGEDVTAFSYWPAGPSTVSATFFALKLLRINKVKPKDVIKAKNILHFLDTCWNERLGAYGSRPGSSPNIVHSFMAVSIISAIGQPLPVERQHRLLNYVAECCYGEGFGFCPGFQPNAYALRCAIDLISCCRSFGHALGRLADITEGMILSWIIGRLFRGNDGSFTGYASPFRVASMLSASSLKEVESRQRSLPKAVSAV